LTGFYLEYVGRMHRILLHIPNDRIPVPNDQRYRDIRVIDVLEELATTEIASQDHWQIGAGRNVYGTRNQRAKQPIHAFQVQRILILDPFQPLSELIELSFRQRFDASRTHLRVTASLGAMPRFISMANSLIPYLCGYSYSNGLFCARTPVGAKCGMCSASVGYVSTRVRGASSVVNITHIHEMPPSWLVSRLASFS
jgi:hypothetical protein